jgi:hypothetical protein
MRLSLRFASSSALTKLGFCCLVLTAAICPAAHAQTPIFDFIAGSGSASAGNNATYGFDFVVTGTQTITSLGIFDFGSNGLINSHDVGLFDNTGNLLASTTITNGLATPVASTASSGQYLARAIGPVTLTAGTYVLAATYTALDDRFGSFTSLSSTPGFAFGTSRFVLGTTALTFPGGSAADGVPFGPMAFTGAIASTAAPEPGSLALLLPVAGMAGMVLRKRRK